MKNMNAALRYLFGALEKAQNASARVREMVKVAIARFLDLCGQRWTEGDGMKALALEIRDEATFIPALAVDINPANDAQRYLMRRVGYACDYRPNILLTRLAGEGEATNDPYAWGGCTFSVAHNWIIEHWDELRDGDVVDVSFILGETPKPKVSERFL